MRKLSDCAAVHLYASENPSQRGNVDVETWWYAPNVVAGTKTQTGPTGDNSQHLYDVEEDSDTGDEGANDPVRQKIENYIKLKFHSETFESDPLQWWRKNEYSYLIHFWAKQTSRRRPCHC